MRMEDEQRHALMRHVLPGRAAEARPFVAAFAEQQRLQRALLPLARAPAGPGWNEQSLEGLLSAQTPAEAAVLVGLVPRAQGTQVLLTRRTEALRNHGGQVGFPGGRVERADRNALVAALRESNEEIALTPAQVMALGYLDPLLTITRFRVTPVVAVIDPAFVPRPEPAEVAEVFEVPLDYLMDPAHLRQIEMEYAGHVRHVFEYDWPGQRIWGATAAILYNLRQRLEQTA